jgi:NADPH:quinone reductase-like Zn-dependent oxidoreductase
LAFDDLKLRFNNSQVGHIVVVTASPRDAERQKRLGASEVVDYNTADAVDRLPQLGLYSYLFTESGDVPSQQAFAAVLQPKRGKFASVLGGVVDLPSNVERVYTASSQARQRAEYSTW